MWNDVYERGMKYVYQLFWEWDFKSDEQVWVQYGLTTIRFNSLKTSIPSE